MVGMGMTLRLLMICRKLVDKYINNAIDSVGLCVCFFFFVLFGFLVIFEVGFEVVEFRSVCPKGIEEVLDEGIAKELHLTLLVEVELSPYLHSVVELKGGVEAVRDETDTVDVLCATLGLAKEVEDEPLVDLLVLLDVPVDLEDEATPEAVLRVLPGGIDALPEVIDGRDVAFSVIDGVSKCLRQLREVVIFIGLLFEDEEIVGVTEG
jgi:hypothetical protein